MKSTSHCGWWASDTSIQQTWCSWCGGRLTYYWHSKSFYQYLSHSISSFTPPPPKPCPTSYPQLLPKPPTTLPSITLPTPPQIPPHIHPIVVDTSIECLVGNTSDGCPSYMVHKFVNIMLKWCMKPTTNICVFSWKIQREPRFDVTTYNTVLDVSSLKETTPEKSLEKWLYIKAAELTISIESHPSHHLIPSLTWLLVKMSIYSQNRQQCYCQSQNTLLSVIMLVLILMNFPDQSRP